MLPSLLTVFWISGRCGHPVDNNKKSPEDEWFVSVREGNFVRPPGGRHSRESAIRRFRRTRIGSEVELVLPVKARIT